MGSRRAKGRERVNSLFAATFTALSITDAQGAARLPIEQAVLGTKVEIRGVEQQTNRNASNFAALSFAKLLVDGVH